MYPQNMYQNMMMGQGQTGQGQGMSGMGTGGMAGMPSGMGGAAMGAAGGTMPNTAMTAAGGMGMGQGMTPQQYQQQYNDMSQGMGQGMGQGMTQGMPQGMGQHMGQQGLAGMMQSQAMSAMQQPGAVPGTPGAQPAGGNATSPTGMGMNMAQMNNPAAQMMMQAMYQQYAMRLAAYQRMAQAASGGMTMNPGMAGMGMAGGPMPGGMGGMGMGQGMPMGPMGPMAPGAGMRSAGPMAMGGGGQNAGGDKGVYYKTRICNKWKDGNCPFGETCKYAHGEQDLRGPGQQMGGGASGAGEPKEKRQMIEMMKKTRLCEEFVKTGSCKYGDRCTFAHGQHELRQAPANPNPKEMPQQVQQSEKGQQGGRDNVRKTRLCERFMTTKACPYGDKCTFAHGHHELRQKAGGQQGGQQGGAAKQGAASSEAAQPAGSGAAASGGMAAAANATTDSAATAAAGVKRPREDETGVETEHDDGQPDGAAKRQHTLDEQPAADGEELAAADLEHAGGEEMAEDVPASAEGHAAEAGGEHECALCAKMVKTGRDKMLAAVQALSTPAAQKLGAMILGFGTPRFDQLWHKLSFGQLQGMLSKASEDSELSVGDKVDLLKTVCFHVHASEEDREKFDSQKYVSQGLPPDIADFVYLCLDGKEGTATMTEYFAALEVCKTLYGTSEEQYFTVSSTMANVFMGM